jgi:hypothetical protein
VRRSEGTDTDTDMDTDTKTDTATVAVAVTVDYAILDWCPYVNILIPTQSDSRCCVE